MAKAIATEWTVLPGSLRDIERLRAHCRSMVRRRALVSAGVAAVPIPGIDVLTDAGLFALLIEDVNKMFGLTPDQIALLQPRYRVLAYRAAVGVGGAMVGKMVTKELVGQALKISSRSIIGRMAARLVPIAGQVASAAIGFGVFRSMGYQHVDACAAVAQQLLEARTI